MPIAMDRVLAATFPDCPAKWTPDDVIRYHLGLGAGPDDLGYVLERCLTVLPSYAVIPAFGWLPGARDVDGLDIDPASLLHGEHDLTIMVVFEVTSRDTDGQVVFVNRFSCFLRGEGGFGGPRRVAAPASVPRRELDAEVRCATLPQQALLYRLSGDHNPLHADPEYARQAGFDRPILHGLCGFGIAATRGRVREDATRLTAGSLDRQDERARSAPGGRVRPLRPDRGADHAANVRQRHARPHAQVRLGAGALRVDRVEEPQALGAQPARAVPARVQPAGGAGRRNDSRPADETAVLADLLRCGGRRDRERAVRRHARPRRPRGRDHRTGHGHRPCRAPSPTMPTASPWSATT